MRWRLQSSMVCLEPSEMTALCFLGTHTHIALSSTKLFLQMIMIRIYNAYLIHC